MSQRFSQWAQMSLSAALFLTAASVSAQDTPPTVARPTTSIERGGCVTTECHPGVASTPFVHGPVSVGACDACHAELDAATHTFQPARAGKDLCVFCHELDLSGQFVHKPVAAGECAQCHNPHGGENRFMLRGGEGAAACLQCHESVTGDLPNIHGPVAAGACTACHLAHTSAFPKLLVREGRDLCLECHLTLQTRLESARMVHGPVAADCTACHLPHASERKMMLKQSPPTLCLNCHTDMKALIEQATTTHDAVSTGAACENCHTPHESDYAALLKGDMVDVCLSCHDREIEIEGGVKLVNMKAVLDTGTSVHGPIAQRSCVACHQIHGGSNFRLLVKEYPPEFYAPFREESYALCFSCHNRDLVLDARTTDLTNFRNGDQNMHFLHVNKETKGRTCRACHETHASTKEKHIRDWVPFGSSGWKLPINFEKTETGGRCSPGCHRPYGYDRENPVTNVTPQSASAATWPEEATSDKPKTPSREVGGG